MRDRTKCDAQSTCAFDRTCEGFIRCVDVDPIGWAGTLAVSIGGAGVICADADCDCRPSTLILPAGGYPFADIIDAIREHVREYR